MAEPSDNQGVTDPEPIPAPTPDPAPPAEPVPAAPNPPVQSEPVPGEQTPAPEEKPESDPGTEQTQQKPEGKGKALPGVQRRISELTSERRELRERNRQLESQLQKQMGNPMANLLPGQHKPEDTADYWLKKTQESQTQEEYAKNFNQYLAILPGDLKRQAVGEVVQVLQLSRQNEILSQKLGEIHERTPIFDDTGRPDPKSPVMQMACELADAQGVEVFDRTGKINYMALEYFAREASWKLQGQSATSNAAALEQQRVQTLRATSRAGLETSSPPAPAKPSGPRADLERQIADLEKQRARLGMGSDSELNARLMAARSKLRQLPVKSPAAR